MANKQEKSTGFIRDIVPVSWDQRMNFEQTLLIFRHPVNISPSFRFLDGIPGKDLITEYLNTPSIYAASICIVESEFLKTFLTNLRRFQIDRASKF